MNGGRSAKFPLPDLVKEICLPSGKSESELLEACGLLQEYLESYPDASLDFVKHHDLWNSAVAVFLTSTPRYPKVYDQLISILKEQFCNNQVLQRSFYEAGGFHQLELALLNKSLQETNRHRLTKLVIGNSFVTS